MIGLAGLDNCSEIRVNFTRCFIGTATLSSFNFFRFYGQVNVPMLQGVGTILKDSRGL